MRFSVITVCFNSEETIQDTLDSVRSQNYLDLEHIIIDGGSSDRTIELVEAYAKGCEYPVLIQSECDNGIYDAMNKGILLSSGSYISFLNSDDVFAAPDILLKIAVCDGMTMNLDVLYGDIHLYDPEFRVLKRRWIAGNFDKKSLWMGWMPPHPSLFVKAALHKRTLFDSSFSIQSDYGFCWDLFSNDSVTSFNYEFVAVHMRIGGASTSGILSVTKGNIEAYLLLKKRKVRFKLWIITLKLVRKISQF